MSKKIFPGNYVNYLSSYQGQPIVAKPGLRYHHLIGYAKVGASSATSFDVIVPSPDKRPDDKPRPDIVGMKVPTGVWLYKVGLRLLDSRKDLAKGTARSGIVGTNGDRLKLASAVNVTDALTATTAATTALTVANTTVAPAAATKALLLAAPILTTSEITLKVFNDDGTSGAGAGVTSSEPGGSFLVAEACWFTLDDVPEASAFGGLPAIVETL
jgi:ribosomal 50S subunit-recycling heat shock protein